MRIFAGTVGLLLLLSSPCFAEQDWQQSAIPGVGAKLAYARQYNGVLHVGIRLNNSSQKRVVGKAMEYSEFALIDAKANKKHFPLKDAEDHYLAGPISNWNKSGLWYPALPPQSETMLWAVFEPVAKGNPITVQTPLASAFENTVVTQGAPTAEEAGTVYFPLQATLLSAKRANGQLNVSIQLSNPPGRRVLAPGSVSYSDVYALDAAGKRKYPLLKDASGLYTAEPKSNGNNGGLWYMAPLPPGKSTFMSLTFQSPPDTVSSVDIVVPPFAPFENTVISGKGGAASGGIAVAGKSLDLQGALKDLKADVSPEQIKVNMSADALFDFDKSELKPGAQASLSKVVTVLKSYPTADVTIDGHADAKGSETYNQALSEKRANTIAQWLSKAANLSQSHVHTKGWGKTKPIAPNNNADGTDNPGGRARNRRVEITVKTS